MDDLLSKTEACELLGCDVRTLERRTQHLTPEQGRIPIGGIKRPAQIKYTRELIKSLLPTPGGDSNG